MTYSAVNGLGLALVIPAAQSLVADYYEEKSRGGAFGLLFGVSSLGARPHQHRLCLAGNARRAGKASLLEGASPSLSIAWKHPKTDNFQVLSLLRVNRGSACFVGFRVFLGIFQSPLQALTLRAGRGRRPGGRLLRDVGWRPAPAGPGRLALCLPRGGRHQHRRRPCGAGHCTGPAAQGVPCSCAACLVQPGFSTGACCVLAEDGLKLGPLHSLTTNPLPELSMSSAVPHLCMCDYGRPKVLQKL